MGKFVILHRSNGTCEFNLLADTGTIVLTSDGYVSTEGCRKGICAVQTNAGNDSQYERKLATDGKYYFCLKSVNGRVLGVSETYDSLQAMEAGIHALKVIAVLEMADK